MNTIPALNKKYTRHFHERYVEVPSGCWEWTARIKKNGYGRFSMYGRDYFAHRVAYETYIGTIPEGMYVCHTCDNTLCVNPGHLFVGTQSDNMKDCVQKGRHWCPRMPVSLEEHRSKYRGKTNV